MVTIKFKKLAEDAVIPFLATEGAACFDLTANRIEEVDRGKIKILFGLACEIPEDYKLCIVPRSSFCLKGWVQANSPGQVDPDYRGEIAMFLEAIPMGIKEGYIKNEKVTYWGHTLIYPELPYKVGERCAQAFLQEIVPTKITMVGEVTETVRGTGGFGSTGL